GLVVARPASSLGVEPFFMKLMSGIENTLADRSTALLLQVVPDHDAEVEAYRRWFAEQRVDGIFLIDLHIEDKRVLVLEELGLPAVVIRGAGRHPRPPPPRPGGRSGRPAPHRAPQPRLRRGGRPAAAGVGGHRRHRLQPRAGGAGDTATAVRGA